MSGIGLYGVMLAGWSSGSKYPLLGSVRASAQLLSYEAAFGLADRRRAHPVGHALDARRSSTSRRGTAARLDRSTASGTGCPAIVAFVIFLIAAIAETNHPPFDLVEAEQELVGGFHTEYTGIRFAIFFLAEFMNVITMCAIAVTLFLGGPSGPSLGFLAADELRQRLGDAGLLVHAQGARAAVRDGVGARHRCPRLRYDQLMALGWKYLIEIAFLWVMVSGVVVVGAEEGWNRVDRRARRRSSAPSLVYAVLYAVDAEAGRARAEEDPLMGVLGLSGFRVTIAPDRQAAVTEHYPEGEAPEADALPRSARPQPLRGRHGEVHRLRAVRGRVPGALHLRARRRQPARRAGRRPASATASSTRSTTSAASTATCASRRAPPRRSPRRSCSSSRSPTATTRSTPRTSCSSTTTAGPGASRGSCGSAARTTTPARGCGRRRRRAGRATRAASAGRASSASACAPEPAAATERRRHDPPTVGTRRLSGRAVIVLLRRRRARARPVRSAWCSRATRCTRRSSSS